MNVLITLIPLSAMCGSATAYVFRRFASGGTRQTVNRILAHVMELRLFIDEPRLILRAQRDLLRENLRLLGQLAIPALLSMPVMALVVWQADHVYGRGPLSAGEPVVVTAHPKSGQLSEVRLEAPEGVAVETPGVRIARLNEVSWRIRPSRAFSGNLAVSLPADLNIPWPRATVLGVSWMVWFFGISSFFAFLTPRIIRRSVAGIAIFVLIAARPANAAEPSSVILISVDTLRADHLSAYGYTKIRTPNIDAFAEKGTIYTRIDSQIPLTLPSHTSLMTSTYPFQSRIEANGERVPTEALTLASVLHANGYKTAAFIGSVILDRSCGLDKGFDLYDSPFEPTDNPYSGRVRRDAALVTRAARQWIGKNRAEPLFAFLHLYDLHTPYMLPQVAGPTPSVPGYDAELAYVDQALGRLRESLIGDGLWDKSLVVLLADHGEGLGDHGETSHGYFIYESTMHVPLIIHWPDGSSRPPERVSESGGLIDVAPTILGFLRIPAPFSFAGVSLLSARRPDATYGESIYPRETFGWSDLHSMQSGTLKYIQAPQPELYDLSKDPAERMNIMAAHPAEARSLKTQIENLIARFPVRPDSSPPELSAKTREVLGSLGYTAGGRQTVKPAADPKDKLAEQEAYENGLTSLFSGHYDKAKLTLQRVVNQDAHNLPALCALGEAYLRAGDARKALELWQQALERDPKYFPAAQSIGEYWLARQDYEKACRFLPGASQCRSRR